MRISKIEQDQNDLNIFIVSLEPNWLENIFDVKPKTIKIKDTMNTYIINNARVYIYQNGETLGNGNWIGEEVDNWRRRF